MKSLDFRWNEEKNQLLKQTRNVSFESVVAASENDLVLDDIAHPTRPNQRILIVSVDGYVYAAPYVREGNVIFLKTVYPNRDFHEKYKVKP